MYLKLVLFFFSFLLLSQTVLADSATYKQDNALTREISFITNLGYEKKITDNGKFTAGLNFKNTSQNVNSLSGNMGFKLNF